jgi:hypothetical protein
LPEPAAPRVRGERAPPLDRRGGRLVIRGPIEAADVSALCEAAVVLLGDRGLAWIRGEVVEVVDLRADLCSVDALARLALAARRLGVSLRFEASSSGLGELLAVLGLDDVLPFDVEPDGDGAGIRPRSAAAARTAGRTAGYRGRR